MLEKKNSKYFKETYTNELSGRHSHEQLFERINLSRNSSKEIEENFDGARKKNISWEEIRPIDELLIGNMGIIIGKLAPRIIIKNWEDLEDRFVLRRQMSLFYLLETGWKRRVRVEWGINFYPLKRVLVFVWNRQNNPRMCLLIFFLFADMIVLAILFSRNDPRFL